MKKLSRKYILVLVAAIPFVGMQSCEKDFVDEQLVTSRNTGDFEPTEGLDGLAAGRGPAPRLSGNYEWAYAATNYGLDAVWVGVDRSREMWGPYGTTLNSMTGDVAAVWDNMYGAINSANTVIANVPLYYTNEALKNTRLGEGHFIRAFNYFKLVKQYGGVPL